jgi:hypothetical protein
MRVTSSLLPCTWGILNEVNAADLGGLRVELGKDLIANAGLYCIVLSMGHVNVTSDSRVT